MAIADDVERAIQRLQSAYWARVDFLDPAPAEALFTEDGLFELGALTLRGRGELGPFFRKRQEAGAASGRITRHLAANLRLRRVDDLRVAASSTVMVMTGYGELPIAAATPSVGDFEDVCLPGPEGFWLFEHRKAVSVFAGPDAPAFARAAPVAEDR